jgi:hypothetical protein
MSRTPMSQVIPYAPGTTLTANLLDQICANLALGSDMAALLAAITPTGSNAQVGGKLGIGMAPVNVLDITQNQNAVGGIVMSNPSTGSIAGAGMRVTNGTHSISIAINSTGYSPFGMNRVDGASLTADGAGGLSVLTNNVAPLYFGINFGEVGQFSTTGDFFLGNSGADRGTHGLVKVSSISNANISLYGATGTPTFSWAGRVASINSPANWGGVSLQVPPANGGIVAGTETYVDGLRVTFDTLSGFTSAVQRWTTDGTGHFLIGYTVSNGAFPLQVNGQIFATSATIQTSDAQFKTNITPIEDGALDLVCALKPVEYDHLPDEIHNFPAGRQIGFLAQDVQKTLAGKDYLNAVVHENTSEAVPAQLAMLDEEGAILTPAQPEVPGGTFLGLADAAFTPLVIKAIQELSDMVKSLQGTVAVQASLISALQSAA